MKERENPRAFGLISRFRWYLVLMAALLLYIGFLMFPRNPIAVIEVVDNQGKPIPGASVKPYALRPKPEGGHSGHYFWKKARYGIPPDPVVTDDRGKANVPYPKFVVERLETNEISILINHPRYVSANHHVTVSTSPPHGAPWQVWIKFILSRLRQGATVTRSNPTVLESGHTLILKPVEVYDPTMRFYAQTSSKGGREPDFWDSSQPGRVMTRKHASGDHSVRLIGASKDSELVFSEPIDIHVKQDVTNSLSLSLKPGKRVRGILSDIVPRPIEDGRVVANIVPHGRNYKDRPPLWHAWTPIKEDGSFELSSLPSGQLEIVALCNGYVSRSRPGQRPGSAINYPQKHVIAENHLDIVMDMEPTARLAVTVLNEEGHAIEGAKVVTSPNVRWGDWASTIFAGDLYNTFDRLQQPQDYRNMYSLEEPNGFWGLSDKSGKATLSNVPVWIQNVGVAHPDYVLPKIMPTGSVPPGLAPRREATVVLQPGVLTETVVHLEPINKDPQRHY